MTEKNIMTCWICSNTAGSGEHRLKASDLKLTFGELSQASPIYTKDERGAPVTIKSIKSDRLKFKNRICHHCNTTRTQPHDLAWQRLSEYVANVHVLKKNLDEIVLANVFAPNQSHSLLQVHLYFNKMIGCVIKELGVPISTVSFSNAILNSSENKELRLCFNETQDFGTPYAQLSQLEVVEHDKRIISAFFIYTLNRFHVEMVYTANDRNLGHEGIFWLPSEIAKKVQVRKLPSQ